MKTLSVGDTFVTTADLKEKREGYYATEYLIPEGTMVEVRKIAKKKMMVKCEYRTGWGKAEGTIWMTIEGIQRVAGTIEEDSGRTFGEIPTDPGTIQPDDPGLAWLWEDLIRYGKRNGMVPVIDKLTDALGIPGRSRVFTAVASINGLEMTSQIEARSQNEANKKLKQWIIDNA